MTSSEPSQIPEVPTPETPKFKPVKSPEELPKVQDPQGSTPTALVIFHPGVEEMEAIAVVDILRRGWIACTTASTSKNLVVKGKHNIEVKADTLLDSVLDETYDCIVIPGGPGIMDIKGDARIHNLLRMQAQAGRLIGAICAAPLVLKEAGLLTPEIRFTSYPSTWNELPEAIADQIVVKCDTIITSQGPGTAVEFGLALLAALLGQTKAQEIREQICAPTIYHPDRQ